MKKYYKRQGDSKIIVYAVILAVILGIGAIVVQDVQIPAQHVVKEVKVNIDQ